MLKNIAKLGLVGLFSAALAGCGTTTVYKMETQRVRGSPTVSEVKEKTMGEVLEYHIGDVNQCSYDVSVPVFETKKENKLVTKQFIIPIYENDYEVAEAYDTTAVNADNFVGWPILLLCGGLRKPTEGILVQRDFNLKDQKRVGHVHGETKEEKRCDIVYENQPARDVLVKVSSQYFGFGDGKESSILGRTDESGVAAAKITRTPHLWYLDEGEITRNVRGILEAGMREPLLDKIDFNSLSILIKNKEYPINVKTMSESDFLLNTNENLKIVDDEKTFQVRGKEIDISPLYSYIENVIKSDLENKYMPRSVTIRAVGEDLYPVDALIEFKKITALSLEELLNETERIKEEYLARGEGLFERVNIDPSYLLCDLDGQRSNIPAEGLEININVPSEYNIRVIKEGYAPLEARVAFTEAMQGVMEARMSQLGTRVNLEQGRSTYNFK